MFLSIHKPQSYVWQLRKHGKTIESYIYNLQNSNELSYDSKFSLGSSFTTVSQQQQNEAQDFKKKT
jgi:hypothetical protein